MAGVFGTKNQFNQIKIMKLLITGLAVVFILYTVWTVLLYGILKSISESYYTLQRTKHGFIFTIFMLLLMTGLLTVSSLTNHEYSWLFFLSASGAAFVGLAASFWDTVTRTAHFFGATLLILGSLVGIGFVFTNWIPLYIMIGITITLILFRKKQFPNVIYWFEIAAFTVIITGLYIQ